MIKFVYKAVYLPNDIQADEKSIFSSDLKIISYIIKLFSSVELTVCDFSTAVPGILVLKFVSVICTYKKPNTGTKRPCCSRSSAEAVEHSKKCYSTVPVKHRGCQVVGAGSHWHRVGYRRGLGRTGSTQLYLQQLLLGHPGGESGGSRAPRRILQTVIDWQLQSPVPSTSITASATY